MLLRPGRLELVDETNHVGLPLDRSILAFVANLEEHVVKIVHGIDDSRDVSLLGFTDAGIPERVNVRSGSGSDPGRRPVH